MLVARLSGVGYTTRRKLGGAVARLGSGRNRISPFPLRPFTLLSFISGGAWIVGGRKARAFAREPLSLAVCVDNYRGGAVKSLIRHEKGIEGETHR